MSQTIEFHLKGENNRNLLVEWDNECLYLSIHIPGGHVYMMMDENQSKMLIEAIEVIKEAQEGP